MKPTREAIYAGRFYPAGAVACARQADGFVDRPAVPGALGGLMPHAGWVFSGPTAGWTVASLREQRPDTLIIFGAVHVLDSNRASLYPAGRWPFPGGSYEVDSELASLIGEDADVTVDPAVHAQEHSIEVELPLLARAFPAARIVPIMVRPGPWAAGIGRRCVRAALDLGRAVVVLASTDLTHYGPRFGFEPYGQGETGIRWAKDVNDRRFIDLVGGYGADEVVPEAAEHRNACGSGAVAATIAAAAELGASAYRELDHTTSAECGGMGWEAATDSVGYHSGVFVKRP